MHIMHPVESASATSCGFLLPSLMPFAFYRASGLPSLCEIKVAGWTVLLEFNWALILR